MGKNPLSSPNAPSLPGASPSPASPGERLPEAVRTRMEALFQTDFSQVRVHHSPGVERFGAEALASGDHLSFAPGRYAPDSREGIALLAHELTHVVQQRQGRASAPSGLLLEDSALEAEADHVAQAVADAWDGVRAAPPTASHRGLVPPHLQGAPRQGAHTRVFQPFIKMARERHLPRMDHFAGPNARSVTRGHYTLLTDFNAVNTNVLRLASFIGATGPEQAQMSTLLRGWMGVPTGQNTVPGWAKTLLERDDQSLMGQVAAFLRLSSGKEAQWRYYNTYRELTDALLGTVRSIPEDENEGLVARAVLRTPAINFLLRGLARKIVALWQRENGAPSWLGYFSSDNWVWPGAYWAYHRSITPLRGLLTAGTNTISQNIAILHDMSEWVERNDNNLLDNHDVYYTLVGPALPPTRIRVMDHRNNVGTVNERDPWVRDQRLMRYALHAGPSFTVNGMLRMAQLADASMPELRAVTFAIFAFWNQNYQKACTPIHKYHECMVIAQNYGVPYSPGGSLFADAPPSVKVTLDRLLDGANLPEV